MKYSFSEISRFEDYGYNRREGIVGKYGCQVFDENGAYVTCLICDTMEEVKEKIKELKTRKESVNI